MSCIPIVPKAQYAMTEGHCCKQLGVWGALKAPQQVQGRALVGVQGAKPPENPEIWDFNMHKNSQRLTLLAHFCDVKALIWLFKLLINFIPPPYNMPFFSDPLSMTPYFFNTPSLSSDLSPGINNVHSLRKTLEHSTASRALKFFCVLETTLSCSKTVLSTLNHCLLPYLFLVTRKRRF